MADKLGRTYTLLIQTATHDTLEIALPFTIEFDISRNLLGSANTANLRIYNLNALHRNALRYNMYNLTDFRSVKLYAGYGKNIGLIFQGNIHECWSVREGVNFITNVDCYDGGFAFTNSPFDESIAKGSTPIHAIKQVVKRMGLNDPNVSLGAVSSTFSKGQPSTRGQAQSNDSVSVLREITGEGNFFIDSGQVNCILDKEYLAGPTLDIDSDSGLLGTPVYEQNVLAFDIIFEPKLKVAQLVNLISVTDRNFNGLHKVTSLKHRGMISDAVCGDLTTSIGCINTIGQLFPVAVAS